MSKHIKTLIQEITGVSKLMKQYERRINQINKEIEFITKDLEDKKEILEKMKLELDTLINGSNPSSEKELYLKENIAFIKGQIKGFERNIKIKEEEIEQVLRMVKTFKN